MKASAKFIPGLVVVLLCFNSFQSISATLYSIGTGNWSSTASWSTTSGGASCSCTPGSGDNAIIETALILDQDLQIGSGSGDCANLTISAGASLTGSTFDLEVKTGAKLIVNGDLEVNDLDLRNGSALAVGSAGTIHVHGDFHNFNNSDDVNIDGALTVDGTFENGNGAEITGSGVINYNPGETFTNDGTISGVDDSSGTIHLGAVLPVELVEFKAEAIDNTYVELVWVTATETNNDYFTLERSQNGLTWEEVAIVQGAGTSNETLEYVHLDENPINGVSYYRLTQTDFDGQFEVFDIRAVNFEGSDDGSCVLNVYPNPCPGLCTVELTDCPDNGNSAQINVMMYDAAGNEVYSKIPNRDFNGSFRFDIHKGNNLKPGVYFVKAVSENEAYDKKLMLN